MVSFDSFVAFLFLLFLGEKPRKGLISSLSLFFFIVLVFALDQMAEGTAQSSRYVKLKKDQAPLEDITPGELNQPIAVPQVKLLAF